MSNASQFIGGGIDYWVSGATYALGRVARSPTDHQLYVRAVAGAGTTDPASDATNWRPDGGRPIKSIQRGVIDMGTGAGDVSATVTAVNTAKTELRFLGWQATNNATTTSNAVSIKLTNATTVTATRQYANNTGGFASWELTEYH